MFKFWDQQCEKLEQERVSKEKKEKKEADLGMPKVLRPEVPKEFWLWNFFYRSLQYSNYRL
jgi:hypothetical protein